MNRRSVLKGLLAVAAAAPGFRLPLVCRRTPDL